MIVHIAQYTFIHGHEPIVFPKDNQDWHGQAPRSGRGARRDALARTIGVIVTLTIGDQAMIGNRSHPLKRMWNPW